MRLTSFALGKRRLGTEVAVAVLVLATLLPPSIALAAAPARPDLIVKNVVLTPGGGRWWGLRNEVRSFTWRATTKNVGAAPARRSTTAGRWQDANGVESPALNEISVPRLEPGGAHVGQASFDEDLSTWSYGSHVFRTCADFHREVRESNEGNDCKQSGSTFYVVPHSFTGKVTGTVTWKPTSALTQTLEWSTTVRYDLDPSKSKGNAGLFVYAIAGGSSVTFTFTATETITGCNSQGSRAFDIGQGRIVLGFDEREYSQSGNRLQTRVVVPLTVTCPNTPPTTIPEGYQFAGEAFPWFAMQRNRVRHFDDPGPDRLKGNFRDPNPAFPAFYTWDLQASD